MGRKELVTSPVGEGPARSHCVFQGSILVRFICLSFTSSSNCGRLRTDAKFERSFFIDRYFRVVRCQPASHADGIGTLDIYPLFHCWGYTFAYHYDSIATNSIVLFNPLLSILLIISSASKGSHLDRSNQNRIPFIMRDIQFMRRVLPFPAEIRLEIYRYLVGRMYYAINTVPERSIMHPNYNNKPFAVSPGLVILRVSKATNSEASTLLFDESTFVFKLDFATPFSCDELSRKVAARMKTVCFEISVAESVLRSWQADFCCRMGGLTKQELMTQRTLGLFTGTKCFRDIMRIKFMDCSARRPLCMPYAFLKTVKDLGGFEKLVVEFEFPLIEPDKWTRESELESKKFKDLFIEHDLEPTYGRSIQLALRGVGKLTFYTGFRPRQHLAARLIARAGKMLEEAARLSDMPAATNSLPAIIETLKGL